MRAEFLFRQFHDVGPSARKFPALERMVKEVHPDDFGGNENRFGMFAADDDPLMGKKPRRLDGVPKFFIDGRVGLGEGVDRPIREMKPDGQRRF